LIEDLGMRENGKLAEIRANSELVKIREWKEGPLVKKKSVGGKTKKVWELLCKK
jgi:hypothetical protein